MCEQLDGIDADFAAAGRTIERLEDMEKELRQQLASRDAEIRTLRGHIEQLREAVEEGLSTYQVPMTARICEALSDTKPNQKVVTGLLWDEEEAGQIKDANTQRDDQ